VPLFAVFGNKISDRDLVLIAGGLFLLAKSTHELSHWSSVMVPMGPLALATTVSSRPCLAITSLNIASISASFETSCWWTRHYTPAKDRSIERRPIAGQYWTDMTGDEVVGAFHTSKRNEDGAKMGAGRVDP